MNTTELKALAERLERNHMPADEAKAMMPILKNVVDELLVTKEELAKVQVALAKAQQELDLTSDQLADEIAFNAAHDRLELEMQEEPYLRGERLEGFHHDEQS